MKSGRYQILPRLRKLSDGTYKCTWKDPGKLLQHRGRPLRYLNVFVGLGDTPDVAIMKCRLEYARFTLKYAQVMRHLDDSLEDRWDTRKYPDISLGPSDDYKATSNLPWWKRLFRV